MSDPIPHDDDSAAYQAFQEKVRGTNVNEQTLLATDYLNHFNEIVMILGMVPAMPEVLDEAKDWQPKSYQDHFRDSTVADRELAVAAYDHVPARYREPFEATIAKANRLVAATVTRMEKERADGSAELLGVTATVAVRLLRTLIDHASAHIHGSDKAMDQSEIDAALDGE